MTNVPGAALTLFFADCVAVFILDPVRRCIGLAHAGWRGAAAGVVGETLKAMASEYGARPEDCLAAIGPAIGPCCYEVGCDVASAIRASCGSDRPAALQSDGKWRVDLPLTCRLMLLGIGIPENSVANCIRCTACGESEFFSYRRDGTTGRMAAVMALR